jgi:VCBS repeat-containing protein
MYEQILNFISIKRQVSMNTTLKFVRLFGIGMFLIIMSFIVVQAQGQEWRKIGPWGGNITDIKVKLINDSLLRLSTYQDSIVVASYGAGIFIADSSGGLNTPTTPVGNPKWIARNNGLPSLKVLCLAAGKVGIGDSMYVGLDGNGIYKTTNAGLTWEPAFSSGNAMGTRVINKIAVNPKEFAIAYTATTQGLWKTTDLGATWTELKPAGGNGGAAWKSVAIHEYETSRIYATPTTGGRLHRSTDDGATWNNYLVVDGSAQITAMALAYSTLDTIYIGCNDGKVKEVTFTTNGNTTSGVVVNKSTG